MSTFKSLEVLGDIRDDVDQILYKEIFPSPDLEVLDTRDYFLFSVIMGILNKDRPTGKIFLDQAVRKWKQYKERQ